MALDLPTAGSLEETRLMLEGKLLEREREPWNVQVIIKETAEGSTLSLRDESGVFLEIPPARSGAEPEMRRSGTTQLASRRARKAVPVWQAMCVKIIIATSQQE